MYSVLFNLMSTMLNVIYYQDLATRFFTRHIICVKVISIGASTRVSDRCHPVLQGTAFSASVT